MIQTLDLDVKKYLDTKFQIQLGNSTERVRQIYTKRDGTCDQSLTAGNPYFQKRPFNTYVFSTCIRVGCEITFIIISEVHLIACSYICVTRRIKPVIMD